MNKNNGLVVEGLKKNFGKKTAVRDVSFSMSDGEIVGLLGPNGAGKTTAFYMIVGFIKATDGRIVLDGEDITSFPCLKEPGLVFHIFPRMLQSSENSLLRKTFMQFLKPGLI